jgi:hypothetical protein
MAWVVLSEAHDPAAAWAAAGLRALGLEPLEHVTCADLEEAIWEHHVGVDGARTVVQLPGGRRLDSAVTRGALNRLLCAPGLVSRAGLPEADRLYALHERHALALSWLHSVAGRVLNPPDPRSLCGGWHHPAEWAVLAGRAGLGALPWRLAAHAALPGGEGSLAGDGTWSAWRGSEDVIVAAGRVFSREPLDPVTVDGYRRLAALAGAPVMGVWLTAVNGGPPMLAGATPVPDLRAGGVALLEALAEALGGEVP